MNKKRRPARVYTVSTVDRALTVLEAFTPAKRELSLTEVSVLTRLPAPTALRLLATLARHNMINRSPTTGLYRLGSRLIALADIVRSTSGVPDIARAVMRQVRSVLQETTYLSVRMGEHRIDLEQAEGVRDVRRVITLGRPTPLHIGCPGKVLMAGMSKTELSDYLERTPLGKDRYGKVIVRGELEREILRIRRQGYAETRHPQIAGAISAPIFGPAGDTLATLTVSVPFVRYTEELRAEILRVILDAAHAISAEMGYNRRPDARSI